MSASPVAQQIKDKFADTFYSLSVQGEVEIVDIVVPCPDKHFACSGHDRKFARLKQPAPVGAVIGGLCITDSKVEESQDELWNEVISLLDIVTFQNRATEMLKEKFTITRKSTTNL